MANCEQLPRRHLRFTVTGKFYIYNQSKIDIYETIIKNSSIDKERFEVMKGNPRTFREAAYFAVEESAKVRIIRLSRFAVNYST